MTRLFLSAALPPLAPTALARGAGGRAMDRARGSRRQGRRPHGSLAWA